MNATYTVGNVDEVGRKLIDVTRECLDLAIAAGMFFSAYFFFYMYNV